MFRSAGASYAYVAPLELGLYHTIGLRMYRSTEAWIISYYRVTHIPLRWSLGYFIIPSYTYVAPLELGFSFYRVKYIFSKELEYCPPIGINNMLPAATLNHQIMRLNFNYKMSVCKKVSRLLHTRFRTDPNKLQRSYIFVDKKTPTCQSSSGAT